MKKSPLLFLTSSLLLAGCTIVIYNPNDSSASSSSSSTSTSSTSSTSISSESSGSSSSHSSSSSSHGSSSASSSSASSGSKSSSESSYDPVQIPLSYNIEDYLENSPYEIPATPTSGNLNLLVIPVWFTDSSTYITDSKKETVRSDIETAYFGTEEETGWNSVKTYYESLSHGSLKIDGTVSPWYAPGVASADVDEDKTCSLVQSAVTWYRNYTNSSLTQFDQNNDGYLDAVMLIYAAPDYITKSGNENLWAYCYWIQKSSQKSVTKPGPNTFFWASYDFMYGDNKSTYSYGDTDHCSIDAHTFIHEAGHVFGFEDYYDYSNTYYPAGGLTMQDMNVGCHDPYSALLAGWSDPYIPTDSCEITIEPFAESGDTILLCPENTNSPFDEYLLLEYYAPTGLNEFDATYSYFGNSAYRLSSSKGIRVWHVDGRLVADATSPKASNITNNPNKGEVLFAMSNTYYSSEYADYISPLGKSYANYNQLQMIANSTTATSTRKSCFSSKDLFTQGSSFDMSTYGKQFQNTGLLNSKASLGFSFTVTSITSSSATVKITKA